MIHLSPFPPIEIPAVTLPDLILGAASRHGDRAALIDGATGRRLTYHAFRDSALRAASGLMAAGLTKGDAVAICSPNSPEYAVALFGAAAAGLVVTPINPLYGLVELTHQMRDAGVKALITAPSLAGKLCTAAADAGVPHVFAFGDAPGAISFDALLDHEPSLHAVAIDPAVDPVLIPYSSATTGFAKGVVVTHRNLVASTLQTQAVEQFGAGDTAIGVVPFHHIYGLECVLTTMLWAGGTVVTLPSFEVTQFLDAVARYSVTTAYVVPPIVRTLARHPRLAQYDLSSLRQICSAAAPLPDTVALDCAERIGCIVKQAYGLTEACGFIHLNPREQTKHRSVGTALPNTEFRVVDVVSKQDVAVGELGEIWVRGPQMMRGYLNNPEATALLVDATGWLHTGDIGSVDEEGYLSVIDRAKDLVKFRGLQYRDDELLLSMVEEIGNRRQADERLRFQSLMLENVTDSIVGIDERLRVTFWNRGAEQLFGYTTDEAVGTLLRELTLLDDDEARAQWDEEIAALRRHNYWKGQARRRRKDGSVLWTDVVVAAVTSPGGGRAGWIAIHRDVSELRRNQAMLEESHARLQNLAGRLMDIREQERAAISRELHDELGQSLTRLNMDLKWLLDRLPERLKTRRVAAMVPLVDDMLKTVQHLSSQLRPAILDDLGLDAAIEWQAQEFQHWNGCRCTVDVQLGSLPPDQACGTAVFRILQESLTNVARHARAKEVTIRGRVESQQLVLHIQDDGVGIPEGAVSSARSLGLLGMRERARGVGGHIDIAPIRPRGTRITLRVPLPSVVEVSAARDGRLVQGT